MSDESKEPPPSDDNKDAAWDSESDAWPDLEETQPILGSIVPDDSVSADPPSARPDDVTLDQVPATDSPSSHSLTGSPADPDATAGSAALTEPGTSGSPSSESGSQPDEEWPSLDDEDSPIVATLAAGSINSSSSEPADTQSVPVTTRLNEGSVRKGSPFAVDPPPLAPQIRPIEVVIDGGPLRYTAMGAVAAAAMVLAFAMAATWWFPGGGTLIAALGCVLSIFGLYSNYRYTAATFLLFHLALFIASYGRTIG